MANELQTILDEIKLQKDTYLLPENLKKNVTCLGITGTLEAGSTGEHVVSIVNSDMVITDYSKYSSASGKDSVWYKANKVIRFELPYNINGQDYVCGITPKEDGSGYTRWLIITKANKLMSMIDLGFDNGGNMKGMYLTSEAVIKAFRFSDITDISSLESGYGLNDVGVECSYTELPNMYVSNNCLALCSATVSGLLGQNVTNEYHTGWGEVVLITDKIDTQTILSNTTNVYDNTGKKLTGTFDVPLNAVKVKGVQFDISNVFNETYQRNKDLYVVLPETYSIAGKYYVLYEFYDFPMERYEHVVGLVTSDKPMQLRVHNYYEPTEGGGSTEGYIYFYTSTDNDTVKAYQRNLNGDQNKWSTIFTENDVNYSLLNSSKWSEFSRTPTVSTTYPGMITNINDWRDTLHVREESYCNCRVITNCEISTVDTPDVIRMKGLLTKYDITSDKSFIDIDGTIVSGTMNPEKVLNETEYNTALATSEDILGTTTDDNSGVINGAGQGSDAD